MPIAKCRMKAKDTCFYIRHLAIGIGARCPKPTRLRINSKMR